MTLGQRINKLRNYIGLTQQEIADMLQISRSTYAKYETDVNEPNISVLVSLSRIFEVSIDYLVTGESREFDDNKLRNVKIRERITQLESVIEDLKNLL